MLGWVGLGLLQTHLPAIPVVGLSLPESHRNLSKSFFCFKASKPLEAAKSAHAQVLLIKWCVRSPSDITTNAVPLPQRHSPTASPIYLQCCGRTLSLALCT